MAWLKKTRKIISSKNVFEEALERIRFIFDEFGDNVIVSFSGWKDSTVTLEIARIVARERGLLPLKVAFLDQESERSTTVDYMRDIAKDPEIKLYWLQVPIKITQSTTFQKDYFHCRGEGENWMREKEPDSIHDNVYGTDRFADMFSKFASYHYGGQKFCYLGWVRAEESPRRYMGLTQGATYKWITRGKKLDEKQHFTFYPVYDWTYIDVRKAIQDNGWQYNKLYDYQYRYGVPITEMRVSSLIHETAIKALFYLPEVDKALYNAFCDRMGWVSTTNHLKDDFLPEKLPFMFKDRCEYRDYLLEKLITSPEGHARLKKAFIAHDSKLAPYPDMLEKVARKHIASILTNDTELTKIKSIDAGGLNRFLKEKKIELEEAEALEDDQENI